MAHWRVQRRQRKSNHTIGIAIVCLTLLGLYFLFFWIFGARGIVAKKKLHEDLAQQQSALTEISEKREALEFKVKRLRPDSMDRDLLEEQVRSQRGYAHQDEVVIPAKQLDPQAN